MRAYRDMCSVGLFRDRGFLRIRGTILRVFVMRIQNLGVCITAPASYHVGAKDVE